MNGRSNPATTWRAPLCRRPDEHPEVEHNWESLGRLGKVCSCDCHTGFDLRGSSLDPAHLYVNCAPCGAVGNGNRIARDPFDDGFCVYGHPLQNGRSEPAGPCPHCFRWACSCPVDSPSEGTPQ